MKKNNVENEQSIILVDGKILTKGFGQIPTSLMEDSTISLHAKALYVYLVCKTGAQDYCYPSKASIMKALGIKTKVTLRTYKDELVEKGLLKVEKRTYKSGQLTSNKYYPVKMTR